MARFDCHTVKAEELCSLESNHAFKLTTAGNLAGFALWFDCLFEVRTNNRGGAAGRRKRARDSASESCAVEVGVAGVPEQGQVVLSTSPKSDDTHWKQTVCMLELSQAIVGYLGIILGLSWGTYVQNLVFYEA